MQLLKDFPGTVDRKMPGCQFQNNIAGMVAAMTESDPGVASERASDNTPG